MNGSARRRGPNKTAIFLSYVFGVIALISLIALYWSFASWSIALLGASVIASAVCVTVAYRSLTH